MKRVQVAQDPEEEDDSLVEGEAGEGMRLGSQPGPCQKGKRIAISCATALLLMLLGWALFWLFATNHDKQEATPASVVAPKFGSSSPTVAPSVVAPTSVAPSLAPTSSPVPGSTALYQYVAADYEVDLNVSDANVWAKWKFMRPQDITKLFSKPHLNETSCDQSRLIYTKGFPVPEHCLDMNLVYIKLPKTGSSTLSGIARRIGSRFGLNCWDDDLGSINCPEPRVVANHLEQRNRDKQIRKAVGSTKNTFLYSFVRHPVERFLSRYYFELSRGNRQSGTLISFANQKRNFMWKYLDMKDEPTRDLFNFLGVSERFEESHLILAHILNLTIGDLLYVSAKVSGEDKVENRPSKTLARHIPLNEQPPDVQQFFKSNWTKINGLDFLLYEVANRHLDKCIETIGRSTFERRLAFYQHHLANAQQLARDLHEDVEIKGNCFWRDNGCAINALNKYANENNLFQLFVNDI